MIDFKQALNEQQYLAATAKEDPLLILAGAGSGKTRTLIYRTAFLIQEKKYHPSDLLLLTFTNKAAAQMGERLSELVTAGLPFAGTFHRFCASVLRRHAHEVGLGNDFVIYDSADQIDLVKIIMKQLDISPKDLKPRVALSMISSAKNELISSKQYASFARGPVQEQVAKIYQRYQVNLLKFNAVDFSDLLLHVLRIFGKNQSVLQNYQRKFKHVLVDEYQDTNKVQYALTKLLVATHQHLTAVGDASQSIYRWRGADHKNLDSLQTDFPDLKIIRLEQNYRSTQNILDAAYAVIANNKTHPILDLWTESKAGENLVLYEAESEYDEAKYVIGQASRDISHSAVLYRTNAQSRALEEAAIRAGIPYVLVGGTKFYERREIKDVLSFLRIIANPKDEVSQARALKLGKRRLQAFQAASVNIDPKSLTAEEVFVRALEASNYLEKYDPKDPEDLSRIENVKELQSVASGFEHLGDFLENVALVENNTLANGHKLFNESKQPLTLMTAHTSKGLEFDQVFVVGLEEGIFPHSRSLLDSQELEEERRLCYVALTRAKTKIHLTYARQRRYFGGRQSNTVSRFISEIPGHLIKHANPFATSSYSTSKKYNIDDDLLDQFLDDEVDIEALIS